MVASYRRETFSRIGGHPALDLINTVEWRLSSERFLEDLASYDDVLRCVTQLDLVDPGDAAGLNDVADAQPGAAAREAEAVRALRDALYRTLFEGDDPAPVLTDYRDALAHADLQLGDGRWSLALPVDLALPRRRIAVQALDLLTTGQLDRLGQCEDAECGWVFLDTSPRRNRRWCVAADCGNRNRVRGYYARARAAVDAG